jgi:hypoxanthine phosphoribosyltransferase
MEGYDPMTQTELDQAVGEVLIEQLALQSRIAELGTEISADYAGRDLLLVGVLKGAVFFMADLMRELTVPCEIDFMAISSYGAATDSSGVVRILKDLDINVADRDVLVVEDIIDSGLTLSYLMRNLRARKPASLEVVTLLTKPERREIDVPVRYVRHRLRPGFRGAVPESPVRGRSQPRARAERHVVAQRPANRERGARGRVANGHGATLRPPL